MAGSNNLIYILSTSVWFVTSESIASWWVFVPLCLIVSLSPWSWLLISQEFEKPETWWMKAEKCQCACQIWMPLTVLRKKQPLSCGVFHISFSCSSIFLASLSSGMLSNSKTARTKCTPVIFPVYPLSLFIWFLLVYCYVWKLQKGRAAAVLMVMLYRNVW